MAGFTIDQHLTARHARLRTWTIALGVAIIAFVANMYLVLAFGGSASMPAKISLAIVIVGVTVYAMLNTNSAIKELAAIRKDKVTGLAKTNYQKAYNELPLSQFMQISNILYVAMGATQIWAVFAS